MLARISLALLAACLMGIPATASELPLQKAAQRALGDRPGAIVAMRAHDGRLQAVVNPRLAAGSAQPIGSLAKLVTALAALDARVTDGARSLPCRGRFERWTCWKVHGNLTLEDAIAQSCSSYFFAVGRDLGAPRLNRAFAEAGFGQPTGSGLPGERSGMLRPARTRAELTELAYGDTPALLATPLQVASWVGAIANGGKRYAPHFGDDPPRLLGSLRGAQGLDLVRTGMRRAVLEGSAKEAGVERLAVHGKTGTATHLGAEHRRHGWFVGFAEDLVVVVFVRTGNGYADAAPIAREVFAAWR